MKVLSRSACISPKLLRLLCKARLLGGIGLPPHRMNGILISTNHISITKTTHVAREKKALCWLLFCTKSMLSSQKSDYKG